MAPYNRHAEAFGMQYGPSGSSMGAIASIGGSSTGLAQGLMQVIPINADGTFNAVPDPMKLYQVSQYSDVANLPAMSRRDPDQGRGFIHAYYGVPNPAYHMPGAVFMPEVQTFSIAAVSGYANPSTDNRESITFTLVPATWDPTVQTTPGTTNPSVPLGPSPTAPSGTPITNPTTNPSTGVGSNPGNSGSTTGTGGVKTGMGNLGLGSSSGCGCTTAGSDQSSGLAGFGVLGLGFALLGLRRNKKES
jgi:MYXO-CTERM domain-containing protein